MLASAKREGAEPTLNLKASRLTERWLVELELRVERLAALGNKRKH